MLARVLNHRVHNAVVYAVKLVLEARDQGEAVRQARRAVHAAATGLPADAPAAPGQATFGPSAEWLGGTAAVGPAPVSHVAATPAASTLPAQPRQRRRAQPRHSQAGLL